MKITIAVDPVKNKPRTQEELNEYFGGLKFKTGNFPISYWKEIIENGYTVTYCFKDEEFKREKGYQKNNYIGTEFIVVDVDELDEDPDTFVSKLKYQPTIYHTTFSNLTEYKNNKPCIHLIYCFDEFIPGENNFRTIFDMLVEGVDYDKKARDCHRCIFTSNSELKGFIYRETGKIYHMSDFIQEKQDTLDTLFKKDKVSKNESAQYIVLERDNILSEQKITQSNLFGLSDSFKKEYYGSKREDFIKNNSIRYDFYTSTRIDPTMYNEKGYADLRGINYFEVPSAKYRWDHINNKPIIQKIKNGQRNNTLWLDAIAFMMIIQGITPEHLVYCLTREVYEHYMNSDMELSNTFIISKAKDVWNSINSIDKRPVRKKFKIYMPYWKSQGITDVLQISRIIMKDIKDNDFGTYYDFSKTLEQNLTDFKELGIRTTKRTLEKWLKENNLEYTTDKQIRNNYIIELYKQGNSTREIERICKTEGINVSQKTVVNIINKVSKNESAQYIVLEREYILRQQKITHPEKDNSEKDMKEDSFKYNWDWIKDVGNFIENDPFMQSHRGREYAIKIGLIKEVPEEAIKPNVNFNIETTDFKQKAQTIYKTNLTLDDITHDYLFP